MLKYAIIICVIFVASSIGSYEELFQRKLENTCCSSIEKRIAETNTRYEDFQDQFDKINYMLRGWAVGYSQKNDAKFLELCEEGNHIVTAVNLKAWNISTTDCDTEKIAYEKLCNSTNAGIIESLNNSLIIINNGMKGVNIPNPKDQLDKLTQEMLKCSKKSNRRKALYCILDVEYKTLTETTNADKKIIAAIKKLHRLAAFMEGKVTPCRPLETFMLKARSSANIYENCVEQLISKASSLEN